MRLRYRSSGFTLIELMIVLVLLSIVATVALPGFSYVIESNRQTTVSNSLLGMLHYARTEAVRRSETTEVAPDGAGSFLVIDESGTAIRQIEALPGDVTVVRTDSGGDNLQFRPSGRSNAVAAVTYRVCGAPGADGIVIRVNRGGQINTDPTAATCP